jgi:NAD-dependent SIR2 family protein deacetylase
MRFSLNLTQASGQHHSGGCCIYHKTGAGISGITNIRAAAQNIGGDLFMNLYQARKLHQRRGTRRTNKSKPADFESKRQRLFHNPSTHATYKSLEYGGRDGVLDIQNQRQVVRHGRIEQQ